MHRFSHFTVNPLINVIVPTVTATLLNSHGTKPNCYTELIPQLTCINLYYNKNEVKISPTEKLKVNPLTTPTLNNTHAKVEIRAIQF